MVGLTSGEGKWV